MNPLPTKRGLVHSTSLVKVYGEGGDEVRALGGVTLDFQAQRFTAIMGPSGSGKSTLMHCLAGLDRPTSGEVIVAGHSITGMSEKDLTKLRRTTIGFVFQAYNLVPTLTAAENIDLPPVIAGSHIDREWRNTIVDVLGLGDRLDHRPSQLSGGQQQRVACARALIAKPAVVFADEPTGNLDTTAAGEVLTFLRHSVEEFGQSIIMVTHDPVAAAYAHRIVFLADGMVAGQLKNPTVEGVIEALKIVSSGAVTPTPGYSTSVRSVPGHSAPPEATPSRHARRPDQATRPLPERAAAPRSVPPPQRVGPAVRGDPERGRNVTQSSRSAPPRPSAATGRPPVAGSAVARAQEARRPAGRPSSAPGMPAVSASAEIGPRHAVSRPPVDSSAPPRGASQESGRGRPQVVSRAPARGSSPESGRGQPHVPPRAPAPSRSEGDYGQPRVPPRTPAPVPPQTGYGRPPVASRAPERGLSPQTGHGQPRVPPRAPAPSQPQTGHGQPRVPPRAPAPSRSEAGYGQPRVPPRTPPGATAPRPGAATPQRPVGRGAGAAGSREAHWMADWMAEARADGLAGPPRAAERFRDPRAVGGEPAHSGAMPPRAAARRSAEPSPTPRRGAWPGNA